MSAAQNAKTIVEALVNLKSWNGLTLRLSGTAPTASDVDGMIRPAYQLMARKISTKLVKGGALKGRGAYIGVMPKGSTELEATETLEELVPGLRILFLGVHPDEFTVCELEVATPAEVHEAHARAARAEAERQKEAELKQKLHAHCDQLLDALAVLSKRQRHMLPQCDGSCNGYTKMCPYGLEKIIRLCDDAGIDIMDVMMEAVTKIN